MKNNLFTILKIIALLYAVVCVLLYFFQERVIFFPQKLGAAHTFEFEEPFEEISIQSSEDYKFHALHFKADRSKGLIFYLHGNAGSLDSWGRVAGAYTKLNYDVFILDYPGYGKSGGAIHSKEQLFKDMQLAYNKILEQYSSDQITIIGYSIGTGMAAKLASTNNAKRLILQAPYYNLKDLMTHTYRVLPTFLLRYNFETNEYLQKCKMPITIFHGDKDRVIYSGSSSKLQQHLKSTDELNILKNQGHNGMTKNPDYLHAIEEILK